MADYWNSTNRSTFRPTPKRLIVGGGTAAISEARWLNSFQNPNATLTLYTNGLVNLNNYNESFDTVTFNGGTVSSGSGQFGIYQPLTVNPAGVTATINGNLGLISASPAIFIVGSGTSPNGIDLEVNAAVIGTAPSLIKQGAGTMSLAGPNSSAATTLVQSGILAMDNANALGTKSVNITGGTTLKLDVTATMGQNFELSGDGVTGTLGALDVASNIVVTVNGSLLLDAETTFNVAGELDLYGVIYGTGPLTEIGTGKLVLGGSSANTYSGDTLANQGMLVLHKNNGVIAVPGNLTIGTKSSPVNSFGTTATVLCDESAGVGGTNVTVNGGSLYDLNYGAQSLASVTLNNGGAIQTESGTLTLMGATPVTVNPGKTGAAVISGNLHLNSGGNFQVGLRSVFVVGGAPELDLQAVLSDSVAGGITKSGNGGMRLSAANTFFDTMTVNGGTLTLSNSYALGNSASTTVNSNSTLVLEGSIVIQNNSLTLNSSASPAWQSLNGSNYWTGPVALNQTAAIDVEPSSGYLHSRAWSAVPAA